MLRLAPCLPVARCCLPPCLQPVTVTPGPALMVWPWLHPISPASIRIWFTSGSHQRLHTHLTYESGSCCCSAKFLLYLICTLSLVVMLVRAVQHGIVCNPLLGPYLVCPVDQVPVSSLYCCTLTTAQRSCRDLAGRALTSKAYENASSHLEKSDIPYCCGLIWVGCVRSCLQGYITAIVGATALNTHFSLPHWHAHLLNYI